MSENKDPHVAESGDSGAEGAKFVYDFTEGNKDLKDLLGGKGANLAEMTNLGLPVPPGFTITTEACKTYLDSGEEPAALRDEVSAHLEALDAAMGKKLGQADDPLLVSVRSGAKFSMPGIENFAPERTETSSGLSGWPSFLPIRCSSASRCALTSSRRAGGSAPDSR